MAEALHWVVALWVAFTAGSMKSTTAFSARFEIVRASCLFHSSLFSWGACVRTAAAVRCDIYISDEEQSRASFGTEWTVNSAVSALNRADTAL